MTSKTSNKEMVPRSLELLAPARDLECGMAAISHGADAVYIGADRFGARAAAGNSVEDIEALCSYAHRFGAKVYVTVNTIIYEDELKDTQKLIIDLARIGVDALLVQDMATLEMRRVALRQVGRAPVLHASTQMDNRSADKVRWLRSLGFTRAVLARELSVEEIRAIHTAVPDVELEVFVHGALCVSYSGQCYASQYLLGRSANRGECAQVCRMKFDLVDANGDVITRDRYLLSMKDLCQADYLEDLADAGATSFKIEGRLKGAEYVKNVVSAYSRRLDALVSKRPDCYRRASWGRVEPSFQPDLSRTFNRGYTNYFLHGRKGRLANMFTPKALGQFVGTAKNVGKNYIDVQPQGKVSFSNGDGLCYISSGNELVGFRVNRAEGNRLLPFRMPSGLKAGMSLYRNGDVAFEKTLKADATRRFIPVNMRLGLTANGFSLVMSFKANGAEVEGKAEVAFCHQAAKVPQAENMRRQLSRLGNTVYEAADIDIEDGVENMFVPSSILAELRRQAVTDLDAACKNLLSVTHGDMEFVHDYKDATGQEADEGLPAYEAEKASYWSPEYRKYPYLFNVANHEARDFYAKHGMDVSQPAFEVRKPRESIVMQCRYCLRYELGYCVKRGGKQPSWKEPLTLRLGDGTRFSLEFRCDECQMNIHTANG